MTKTRLVAIWTTVLVVGAAVSIATPAAAQDPAEDADDATTATTTHVEYSPLGGLFKIEMPRIPRPGDIFKDGKDSTKAPKMLDIEFPFPVLSGSMNFGERYSVHRTRIVHVPFFQAEEPNDLFPLVDKENRGEKNPFDDMLDQPLFSLFHMLLVGPRRDKITDDPENLRRVRLVDSPVFCLAERADWGRDRYYWEWLNTPAGTTLSYRNTPESSSCKILDVPFVTGFDRDASKEKRKTVLVDFPGGALYKRTLKTGAKPKDEGGVLDTLAASLATWKNEGEKRSLSLVEAPGFNVDIAGLQLGFALYRGDRLKDGTRTCRILSLPLLGPVWSSWRNDSETHAGLFPRLFFRGSPREAR